MVVVLFSKARIPFLQVHGLICLELKKFIVRISQIFPGIESARPGCKPGIQALCLLHDAMDKAKSIIQECSESSKLYLVYIPLRVKTYIRTKKWPHYTWHNVNGHACGERMGIYLTCIGMIMDAKCFCTEKSWNFLHQFSEKEERGYDPWLVRLYLAFLFSSCYVTLHIFSWRWLFRVTSLFFLMNCQQAMLNILVLCATWSCFRNSSFILPSEICIM